jgi:hypothetical protein
VVFSPVSVIFTHTSDYIVNFITLFLFSRPVFGCFWPFSGLFSPAGGILALGDKAPNKYILLPMPLFLLHIAIYYYNYNKLA